MPGLIHIYTGDGKGKTTAALGLATRARGAGLRVCLVQFLKGERTAELESLHTLGIDIRRDNFTGFIYGMDATQRAALHIRQRALFSSAQALARCCDLLILDEAMALIHAGIVSISDLTSLIDNKPDNLELVLTGRAAPDALISRAHYVTEMRLLKHPFDDGGTAARRGIEY